MDVDCDFSKGLYDEMGGGKDRSDIPFSNK